MRVPEQSRRWPTSSQVRLACSRSLRSSMPSRLRRTVGLGLAAMAPPLAAREARLRKLLHHTWKYLARPHDARACLIRTVSGLAQSYLELGAFASAVPCARSHARLVVTEWGRPELADAVELV